MRGRIYLLFGEWNYYVPESESKNDIYCTERKNLSAALFIFLVLFFIIRS